jgi:hypothetical protein
MAKSEQLFELFCAANLVHAERVLAASTKTPDYVLRFSTQTIVAEVKQFDAGPSEKVTLRKPLEEMDESDAFYPGVPGERVRAKIDSAMPQLKQLCGEDSPTLLVLYDNVQLWPEICDAYAITVAMYGMESCLLSNEVAPEGGAKIIARWHGQARRTTSHNNRSLSAIALLSAHEETIKMDLFHNFFARNPIGSRTFVGSNIYHHRLRRNPAEAFSEWVYTNS